MIDVAEHMPLVDRYAAFWARRIPVSARSTIDETELRAIGYETLCKAALAYDPGRGLFEHFLLVKLRGAFLDTFRAVTHARRVGGPIMPTETLNRTETNEDGSHQLIETLVDPASMDDVVESHELLNLARRVLAPRQLQVLILKCIGLREREIGDVLGIATGTASVTLSHARAKLRAAAA